MDMVVSLDTLPEDSYFLIPWRKESAGQHGRLLGTGQGSCRVRVPLREGGWESTNWSCKTEVVATTEEIFRTQQLPGTDGPRANRERSEVKSPVQLVHQICDEMVGAPVKDIIAACVEQGVNQNTAKTQYYHWRKKNGGSR